MFVNNKLSISYTYWYTTNFKEVINIKKLVEYKILFNKNSGNNLFYDLKFFQTSSIYINHIFLIIIFIITRILINAELNLITKRLENFINCRKISFEIFV